MVDPRFVPVTLDQFLSQPPARFRVKGLLSETGLAAIYGSAGHGKTVFTLDLVLHIATGRDWLDRPVKKGRVIYILAEGQDSFGARLKAAMAHNQMANPDLELITVAPNLALDSEPLIATIKATGGADVVVVDTLSRVIPFCDENTSTAMGNVIAFSEQANQELGALVILVHHQGKSQGKGLRGHSSLEAACDQIIVVERTSTGNKVSVEKHKSQARGAEWHFTIESREVGVDEEGEPITAPVAAYTDKPAPVPMGKWQSAVISALADREQMKMTDLIAKVKQSIPSDGKTDRRSEYVKRAVENLNELLEVRDGVVCVL